MSMMMSPSKTSSGAEQSPTSNNKGQTTSSKKKMRLRARSLPSCVACVAAASCVASLCFGLWSQHQTLFRFTSLVRGEYGFHEVSVNALSGRAVQSKTNPANTLETPTHEAVESPTDGSTKKTSHDAKGRGRQRVVILPGPHKTGTTSIQRNMVTWTDPSSPKLQQWTWPLFPHAKTRAQKEKSFSHIVMFLQKGNAHFAKKMAEIMTDQWEKGHSLVIGGEEMDQILLPPKPPLLKMIETRRLKTNSTDLDTKTNENHNVLLQEILTILPWRNINSQREDKNNNNNHPHGSDADVTVSVTYRSPRVDHLLSVWHQKGRQSKWIDFLLEWPADDKQWHCSLNPLGLAEEFVLAGFETVIIDTSGLVPDAASEEDEEDEEDESAGALDISSVIACEVLKVPCTTLPSANHNNNNNTSTNNTKRPHNQPMIPMGLESEPPQIANAYKGKDQLPNMNQDELAQLEEILLRLDQSYCHLKEKVEVLHGRDVFEFCHGREKRKPIDSVEAVRLIKEVASKAALRLNEGGKEDM